MITNLGWEIYQPYTTGQTIEGEPIWDVTTIGSALTEVTQSLLADYEDLTYMADGVEVKIN